MSCFFAAGGDESAGFLRSWVTVVHPRDNIALRSGGYIAHNTIAENRGGGIRCSGGSPTIEHCVISDNLYGNGIDCVNLATPEIHYNDIYGHAPDYGIYRPDPFIVNADNNWWGHSSGPYHPFTNPNGLGDPVSDYVDYDPWLIESAAITVPVPAQLATFMLAQNCPNPFNPVTTIEYALRGASAVTLKVYDVLGREGATLVEGVQGGGTHAISWDASGKASGVYYYRVDAGRWSAVRRMVLAR